MRLCPACVIFEEEEIESSQHFFECNKVLELYPPIAEEYQDELRLDAQAKILGAQQKSFIIDGTRWARHIAALRSLLPKKIRQKSDLQLDIQKNYRIWINNIVDSKWRFRNELQIVREKDTNKSPRRRMDLMKLSQNIIAGGQLDDGIKRIKTPTRESDWYIRMCKIIRKVLEKTGGPPRVEIIKSIWLAGNHWS